MLSSAKSLDDEAARLAVLRDPKRMAALLVRAFSSSMLEEPTNGDAARTHGQEEEDEEVEETQEEFQELERRASASADTAPPLRVVIRPAVEEEDDEDDAEEDEEEGEEDEENSDKPLDEEELEAAATALLTATRIVEELRLKMLLKAGQQMDRQQQDKVIGPVVMTPSRSENNSPSAGGGPGVPVPRARVRSNSACSGCGKSFNPFHRSKNCAACGYAFCPKCSSKNVVLPTCFGYRDESARTCDQCARWFQKAMDRYFDAMELTKEQEQEAAVHRGSMGEIMIEEKPRSLSSFNSNFLVPVSGTSDGTLSGITRDRSSVSSPDPVPSCPSEEIADESVSNDDQITTSSSTNSTSRRRHRRSSIAATSSPSPSLSLNKNKPWFSGHLRAMHVNDRLPRKKKARGESEGGDTENNSPELKSLSARRGRLSSVASSTSKSKDADEKTGGQQDSGDHARLSCDNGGDLVGARSTSTERGGSSLSISIKPSNGSEGKNSSRPRRKTRRSKFSRSASFDLTNLHPALSPDSSKESPDMKRCNTFGPDDGRIFGEEFSSNGSGRSSSMRSIKAFDDSDIVDERAQPDSAEVKMKSEAKLSAAVLRFAVYEMGAKENTGLRQTFGFTKANPVLDRYTLELDCRQRIVRAKSVFMHRFWSFHCDSVQSFDFGSSEGMARLIFFNGGQGNQSLELKFANDDEREQFKQAMDCCRSTNLDRMRGFASRSAMSLPARPELPSPIPDNLLSPTPQEPKTTFSGDTSTSIESELGPTHDTCRDTVDSPILQSIHVPLLPGEMVVKDTELQATMILGPASEPYESTLVWGRIRGKIALTNYRVIFTPFDRVQIQPRCGGQGGIAYIPLFAITQVQLLYPGGRRTKSGRTYYTGMAGSASIISINCKDIRVMRFQLDTHPSVSDDQTHRLRAAIAKMADASQRYTIVERSSPIRTASPGLGPLPNSVGSGSDTPPDRDGGGGQRPLNESKEPHFTHNSSRVLAYAASPVLRPDRILSVPHEISGSFAFSYSIGDVAPDQNGWNLFVDEREFKRQIGGDPAVSPFLKFYKNDRGNICKSYPSKLLLPASMNSSTLSKVADFRAKNRLPVITYYHRRNRCVLTRSSQPLLGNLLSGSSNVSDQLLLGVYRRLPDIIKNQSQSSQSSRPIYIFDARKPKASTGNRLMGKGGVETPQDYPGAVIHHLNIANMYRMQSSFMGLMKLFLPGGVEDSDRAYLSSVESTRWLDHVRLVLDGAQKIARVLELEGASALVHCSDGWDRTAQLCALAQLMIDPYYRTIAGCITVIEKDWCAFGHKFSERTGGDRNRDPQRNKSSPIMFQFIDAVWQMQRQYPRAFEFNERFLLHLANAMTSGLYGTFMYDSRLQRDVNDVKFNTVSVWTPVLMKPGLYTNNDYEKHDGPIWPWVSCKMIRLWENYFFQWHPKFYKCQWAGSLVHGLSSAHDNANDKAKVAGKDNGDVQQHQTPHRGVPNVNDPPALDLLATPITATITEVGGEHEVPTISLSSEDEEEDSSKRSRTASGSYTKKMSKRNLFSLNRGSRQRAQSEENGNQEVF